VFSRNRLRLRVLADKQEKGGHAQQPHFPRQLRAGWWWVTMPLKGQRISTLSDWSWRVTKKELAKAISEELGLTSLVALQAVQSVFDGITETLLEQGRIELRNFGVFEVKKRKPRTARNPRTGEKVKAPAKMVVTFKPGREMEERVAQLKKAPGPAAVSK
jgi:nucleoid DNA-binding protein